MCDISRLARQSCEGCRILRISYRSLTGRGSIRDIDVDAVNDTHIEALSRLNSDFRCFAIQSVQSAELLPEYFKRNSDFVTILKYYGCATTARSVRLSPGPRFDHPPAEGIETTSVGANRLARMWRIGKTSARSLWKALASCRGNKRSR
jgi:hypothetical protein